MNSLLAELCCLRREVRWLRENLLSVMAAGEVNNAIVYVDEDYQALVTDSTIVGNTADGPVQITLPPAISVEGQRYSFVRVPGGGSDLTILPAGSDLINGNADFVLVNDWSSVTLRGTSDGWLITATSNT